MKYEGKDFSYQAIFDFINIYSETFVFRKDEDVAVSAASKPCKLGVSTEQRTPAWR